MADNKKGPTATEAYLALLGLGQEKDGAAVYKQQNQLPADMSAEKLEATLKDEVRADPEATMRMRKLATQANISSNDASIVQIGLQAKGNPAAVTGQLSPANLTAIGNIEQADAAKAVKAAPVAAKPSIPVDPQVAEAQAYLRILGLTEVGKVDGQLGKNTDTAIRNFIQKNSLDKFEKVDFKDVLAKLKEQASTPQMVEKMRTMLLSGNKEDIKAVQTSLQTSNPDLKIDGDAGRQTLTAMNNRTLSKPTPMTETNPVIDPAKQAAFDRLRNKFQPGSDDNFSPQAIRDRHLGNLTPDQRKDLGIVDKPKVDPFTSGNKVYLEGGDRTQGPAPVEDRSTYSAAALEEKKAREALQGGAPQGDGQTPGQRVANNQQDPIIIERTRTVYVERERGRPAIGRNGWMTADANGEFRRTELPEGASYVRPPSRAEIRAWERQERREDAAAMRNEAYAQRIEGRERIFARQDGIREDQYRRQDNNTFARGVGILSDGNRRNDGQGIADVLGSAMNQIIRPGQDKPQGPKF